MMAFCFGYSTSTTLHRICEQLTSKKHHYIIMLLGWEVISKL